jgi:hypothetical protein
MTDIGTFFIELFSPLGLWGGLLCIFLLFYIDAIIFPTIPELFTVVIFASGAIYGVDPLLFAVAILGTIVVAELAGAMTLFMVVRKARVPTRIQNVVKKYQGFLLCPDERMILVNRIAPILPFLGAFIAFAGWELRRSLIYLVVGGVVKYGIILALSGLFFAFFSDRGTAATVTIIMVLTIIGLSMIVSYYRKRRMENAHRTP